MADAPKQAAAEDDEGERVGFHYIKSPSFRTIHVDGAFGGLTPHGYVNMNLFSERLPIPTYLEQSVSDGVLGNVLPGSRVARKGVVRELEVGAMMELETAQALHKWLGEQIAKLNKRLEAAVKGSATKGKK